MLKSPPFSKSFLNLVQFDGKFTGICKKRAVGLTTKNRSLCFASILRFMTCSGEVRTEDIKMPKISIHCNIQGICSQKSADNGDDKFGRIYLP